MADRTVSILATLQDRFTPTLTKLQAGIGRVATGMQGLQNAFAPLTSGLAGLAAGVAGFASISQAIESAKRGVEAEAKLLAATKNRRTETEKILRLSQELQDTTRLEDEQLTETATLMLNMGVSTADIEKNLRAAVDTAAALNLPLETVARDIAKISEGGEPRMISRFVVELKEMQEQGTLAAEGVDLLLQKFGGTEAQVALTVFGRIQQLQNKIGDQGERIGKVFAELKVRGMEVLLSILTKIADKIESPEFKAALQAFSTLVIPALIEVAKVVGVIIGASLLGKFVGLLTTVGTAVASILSGISALAIPIGVIVAAVLLIPGALEGITSFLSQIVVWAEGLAEETKGILKEIGEGKLTVGDLFDFAATRARQFWLSLNATVLTPAVEFTKAIGKIISGIFTGAIAAIGNVLAKSIGGWELIIKHTIKAVLKLAQDAVNLFVNYWNDVAETTGLFDPMEFASFGDNFSTEISDFTQSFIDTTNKALEDSADKVFNSWEEAIAVVEFEKRKANEEIAREEQDLQDRLDTSRTEQTEKEKKRIRSLVEETKKANANILSEIASREKKLADLQLLGSVDFANVSPEQVPALVRARPTEDQKNLMVQSLSNQFKEGKIPLQQYLDLLHDIQEFDLTQQIQQLDAQIAHQMELLELRQTQDVNESDPLKAAEKRLEIDGQINETLDKAIQLQTLRNELTAKLAQNEQKILETEAGIASEIVSRVEAARGVLENQRTETEQQRSTGRLSNQEAFDQNTIAAEAFRAKVEEARQELETLSIAAPDLTTELNAAGTKIDEIVLKTNTPPSMGFTEGLSAGFQETATQLGDLGRLGNEVGTSLASNMSAGLVTLFLEGKEAFKEFLVSFLAGIAQMILQLLIVRAISASLGLGLFPAGKTGGLVTPAGTIKRARGGPVPGPDVDRDIVPALLAPGEFIVNRRAVEHYGLGYMYALNRRKAPRTSVSAPGSLNITGRFAEGGAVGAASAQGPQRAVVVGDEQTMDRLLAGGEGAMKRWMHRNSAELKSIMQERT